MTQCNTSADEVGIVSPDRVRTLVQGLLIGAQARGWTDDALEAASGIKARRIKAYRLEGKEPSLSAALSLATVLGRPALNTILGLIGYTASALEDADAIQPMMLVAEGMNHFNVIIQAAKDNRIDHTEKDPCRLAADGLITILTPLSSAGEAA